MAELFRDFWWLMFPLFGMVIAAIGMAQDGARQNRIINNARRDLERNP
jgi:hypothetical protein